MVRWQKVGRCKLLIGILLELVKKSDAFFCWLNTNLELLIRMKIQGKAELNF
jgi:hypothetical protein